MKRGFFVLCAVTVAVAALAPGASAVVVRVPGGPVVSIAPKAGVSTPSLGGRVVPRSPKPTSGTGNLLYRGGPVLHSSAAYLIFWDPSGDPIPSTSQTLLQQYLTDTAADSGKATNVYPVARQFTDGSSFSDYKQAAVQVRTDSTAFPSRDTTNCPGADPQCLTDAQLRTELNTFISNNGLPTGTGPNAPIYFLVTPSDTNICLSSMDCTANKICAYHGPMGSGPSGILYASIPMYGTAHNPKGCQFDGNPVQEPNGDPADIAIKYLSHEHNETITDPLLNAWFDATGMENGDKCNTSFSPTLGGSASGGTLYNQVINGNHYYTQSEWSNGDGSCEMQPTSGSISPSFSGPSMFGAGGEASFDPSASTSTRGFSSETWDFGDGSTTFSSAAPAVTSHTFAHQGNYTVKLTLVDRAGNIAQTTPGFNVTVEPPPQPEFKSSPSNPATDNTVSFDGSGSSDPNSGQTLSYRWDFGDGSTATGATTSHRYSTPGTYTVKLTAKDSPLLGSGSITHTVTVFPDDVPTANLAIKTASILAGMPAAFDGSSSRDSDGSITSYSWTFGDGSGASSASPTHKYTRRGTYSVTLTVVDSAGHSASAARSVKVMRAAKIAKVTIKKRDHQSVRVLVKVTGAGVVSLGSKKKRLRKAGIVKFRFKAPNTKLKLKLKFVPVAGSISRRTVKIRF